MLKHRRFILETHNSSRRIKRLLFYPFRVKTGGLCEMHYPAETPLGKDIQYVMHYASGRIIRPGRSTKRHRARLRGEFQPG